MMRVTSGDQGSVGSIAMFMGEVRTSSVGLGVKGLS